MKTRKSLFLACIVLLLTISSCIPCLHPLYTKNDLVLNNLITGTWISDDSKDNESIWKIEKYDNCKDCPGSGILSPKNIDGKLYLLTNIQHGDTVIFELYLLKLGDHYYFDFYPLDNYTMENELGNMHLFPVHTFAKVDISSTAINIHQFDIDFLDKLIRQNKIKISHEKSGENIILTGGTEELQKFVLKYSEDDRAFVDPIVLNKGI